MSGTSSAHRFLTSEGLMPSTIFDRGDMDMDVSEEMEEVRELLYEMIKKNFPMGVSSAHLAEKYREEYVSKGLGRELPADWLDQVAAAEEFEAQTRGPLTILFVRLHNTSSFKRPPIPNTNVRIISSTKSTQDLDYLKKRKDHFPLQHSELLSRSSEAICPKSDVTVVAFDSSEDLYIRALGEEKTFQEIKEDLARFYADSEGENHVQIYEILLGGAYALCDPGGDWFRVVIEELPRNGMVKCYFSDVGVHGAYSVRDLRLLPDPHNSVMQIPALAKRVSLNIQEACHGGKLDAILKEILFENDPMGNLVPVTIQLSSLAESVKDKNPVADLWTMDGRAIRDVAQTNFINEKVMPVSTKVATMTPEPTTASVSSGNSLLFADDAEILPMEVDKMPSGSFPAHALFAAGPMDISLRQVSLDPMPDYMYEKLTEECESADSAMRGPPQCGKFYAAMIDDRWERVLCLRASKIDKIAFCVYLVDVGAFHYVRGDRMRRLNSKTPFRKMLMFKSRLTGVMPVGGEDVWPRESHEAVREFFEAAMGEAVQVTPIKSGWSEYKQLNAPSVPLVEAKLSCCGRDLADWLISCGLALPSTK